VPGTCARASSMHPARGKILRTFRANALVRREILASRSPSRACVPRSVLALAGARSHACIARAVVVACAIECAATRVIACMQRIRALPLCARNRCLHASHGRRDDARRCGGRDGVHEKRLRQVVDSGKNRD
jgi:hypothetical protein